jgi:hypothetical protein
MFTKTKCGAQLRTTVKSEINRMEQELITKRLSSNQQSILLAKVQNFIKRSVFKYFIASILLAIGLPSLFGGFVWTLLGTFATACLLSFLAMYLSSKSQSNKNIFDANVTFGESEITIEHLNKSLSEKRNWDWIINSEENKYGFFLTIQKQPRVYLILAKIKLTENEENEFRSLLERNGPKV